MIELGGALGAGAAMTPLVDAWITRRLAAMGLPRSAARRAATRRLLPTLLGLGWALAFARVGWAGSLPAHLAWATVTTALVITDLEHHLIPNRILYPGTGVTAALLAAGAFLDRTPDRLGSAALGALLCLVGMAALAALARGAMGMGDVKLSALLGLLCGYRGVTTALAAILSGFLIGGVAALVLLLTRRAHRHTRIPFGPALVAGAWISLLGTPP